MTAEAESKDRGASRRRVLHDPDRVILRRALRVMVVSPTLFALFGFALDRTTVALFASFGSFALLGLTDLGGALRHRFVGYLTLTAVGAALIAVGTPLASWIVAASVSMGVVAFSIRFVGVFGGYFLASSTALTLAFVLAVALPTTNSALTDRLLGWTVAGCVAAVASVVLWPAHERQLLAKALATTCHALADLLEAVVATPGPADVAQLERSAAAAVEAARARFRSSTRRPVGPTAHERALVRSIGYVGWLLDLARVVAARPDVQDAEVTLMRANGADLRRCGDALRGAGPVPIDAQVAAREHHLDVVVAAVLDAAGGDAGRVAERLEEGFPTRAISFVVLSLATEVAVVRGEPVSAAATSLVVVDDPAPRAVLARARRMARNQLRIDAVWLRDALRVGIALGTAVAIALTGGLPHAFWVALGTLSVLRSSALSTGYTVLQSVVGTAIGFVLAAGLVSITAAEWFLWLLLPITVFLAGYTPSAVHFVVGQASFTLFVVVLFNLLVPEGWRTGLVRLGDVALGAAVSLVVSVVFWPRGASAQLRAAATAAIAAGGRYIADAVARLAAISTHGSDGTPDLAHAREFAAAADRRASEALLTFLAERGRRRMAPGTAEQLMTTWVLTDLIGGALEVMPSAGDLRRAPAGAAQQLCAEADALADRLQLDGPVPASAPSPAEWTSRDLEVLVVAVGRSEQRDDAMSAVVLSWVAAWLHHLWHLAGQAEQAVQEADAATARPWWR